MVLAGSAWPPRRGREPPFAAWEVPRGPGRETRIRGELLITMGAVAFENRPHDLKSHPLVSLLFQLQLTEAKAAVEEYESAAEGSGAAPDADELSGLNEEVAKLEAQVKGSPHRYSLANTTIAAHWMKRHPFVLQHWMLRTRSALSPSIVDMVSLKTPNPPKFML